MADDEVKVKQWMRSIFEKSEEIFQMENEGGIIEFPDICIPDNFTDGEDSEVEFGSDISILDVENDNLEVDDSDRVKSEGAEDNSDGSDMELEGSAKKSESSNVESNSSEPTSDNSNTDLQDSEQKSVGSDVESEGSVKVVDDAIKKFVAVDLVLEKSDSCDSGYSSVSSSPKLGNYCAIYNYTIPL